MRNVFNMKFIIFDNSIVTSSGHSLNYCLSIKEVLTKAGLECKIYTSKIADDKICKANDIEKIFDHEFSFRYEKEYYNYYVNYLELNAKYLANLNLVTNIIEERDIIFIPTTSAHNMLALYWWMLSLPVKPRKICVFLRWNEVKNVTMINALQHLKAMPQFRFVTDTNELAELYKQMVPSVKVVPIPHVIPKLKEELNNVLIKTKIQNLSKEKKNIAYVGEARYDKGFQYLPNIIEKLIDTNKYNFIIKTTTKVGGNDINKNIISNAVKKLYELSEKNDNIVIIDEPIDVDEYYKLFNYYDIILLPYEKAYYNANSSGILAEAIAHEIPVIVTKETWLSRTCEYFEIGYEDAANDVDAYVQALKKLDENYNENLIKSKQNSNKFIQYHNPENLVIELMED